MVSKPFVSLNDEPNTVRLVCPQLRHFLPEYSRIFWLESCHPHSKCSVETSIASSWWDILLACTQFQGTAYTWVICLGIPEFFSKASHLLFLDQLFHLLWDHTMLHSWLTHYWEKENFSKWEAPQIDRAQNRYPVRLSLSHLLFLCFSSSGLDVFWIFTVHWNYIPKIFILF